uniref:Uncharacterized protein n=1 Tax=Clytia hemisphaerica TaxID=252671 RepID=A0A7M5X0S8_9CNID
MRFILGHFVYKLIRYFYIWSTDYLLDPKKTLIFFSQKAVEDQDQVTAEMVIKDEPGEIEEHDENVEPEQDEIVEPEQDENNVEPEQDENEQEQNLGGGGN